MFCAFSRQLAVLPTVSVGKVWKPKEEEKVQINEDDKVETEWDEVLAQATEEELVDLAGLEFTATTLLLLLLSITVAN